MTEIRAVEKLVMRLASLSKKMVRGLPYLAKELRVQVSEHTPLFIARPRVVHLWRHAPCNGRCVMCHYGFTRGEAYKALSVSPLTDDRLPRLLEEIREVGGHGTMVSYMGGEPLLSRGLLDWLDQAKRLKLDFRFTTNGYLVDERVAQRLVAADLFNIGVSLESLDPAINEVIRPVHQGTARTIRTIELLLEERRKQRARLSINIKCTLTQVNFASIIGVLERWGREDGVIVTPQVFEALEGMPRETRDQLWISDLNSLEATLTRLREMRDGGYHLNADDSALRNFALLYRADPDRQSTMGHKTVEDPDRQDCHIGTDNLFIHNDGSVKLCPHYPAIGNVLHAKVRLREMWGSPLAHQVRADIRKCRALCTLSCLRGSSFRHKVRMFLKM
jgi:MoaA/NifB/PqqE/SkfB family radical SAM enzyme